MLSGFGEMWHVRTTVSLSVVSCCPSMEASSLLNAEEHHVVSAEHKYLSIVYDGCGNRSFYWDRCAFYTYVV